MEHGKLVTILNGVLATANAGHLPPFAMALGLPATELASITEPVPDHDELLSQTPPLFYELIALMLDNRSAGIDVTQAKWLAHAIAAGTFGQRHLWEDLGADGRATVSALMRHYFEPLFLRNTLNLKWKRFLYEQLGAARGTPGLRPPGCGQCDQFQQCFPAGPT